jgi:tryptophan 2,3-dioxygenase
VAEPTLAEQTAAGQIAVWEAPAEPDGHLSYGTYLRLTELLAQQVPQADPPAPDELASVWRSRHVSLVERQIGLKPGTGGSPGAPYLRARVPLRYYPMLWQLREYL